MAVTKIHGSRQIADNTILNAQIGASAAIDTSKLADAANFILRTGVTAFTANQSMGGFNLTNLATPTAASDAATKALELLDRISAMLYRLRGGGR